MVNLEQYKPYITSEDDNNIKYEFYNDKVWLAFIHFIINIITNNNTYYFTVAFTKGHPTIQVVVGKNLLT